MLWGNEASVLVGDFLLGQAFKMMVEVGSMRSLDILSTAAAVIAEGEVMQLGAAKNTATTEDEYLAVIRAKTAELFAAACEVGPVIAALSKDEQAACRSFGMNLGIAFQLVDDLLDYTADAAALGKPVGGDLREGKVTLPIILLLKRGGEEADRLIRDVVRDRTVSPEQWRDILRLLSEHRTTEQAYEAALEYAARAKSCMAAFPPSQERDALLALPDYVVSRDR
jgi:octaprenyl-diphosphate synthase